MSTQSELASLNATGNGLIGSFGNAGTTTGLNAGLGVDLGQDATNSMGSAHDSEEDGADRFDVYEEVDDFTATQKPSSNVGRMGSLGI